MNGPTVSVITATKNESERIAGTMQSVNRQTGCSFEHVIIDGRSTDGTLEVIGRYEEKHTRVHVEPDSGIAEAMNRGVQRARGDLVIHLNAGDLLVGTRTLSWVADAYSREGWRWAIGASIQQTLGGDRCRYHIPREYSYEHLVRTNIVNHQATFVERSVFEEFGGFDGDFSIALDYEYWLRIGRDLTPSVLPIFVSFLEPYQVAANSAVNYWEDRRARRRHGVAESVASEALQLGVRLVLTGARYVLPALLFDAARSGKTYRRLRNLVAPKRGREDVFIAFLDCPDSIEDRGVRGVEDIAPRTDARRT